MFNFYTKLEEYRTFHTIKFVHKTLPYWKLLGNPISSFVIFLLLLLFFLFLSFLVFLSIDVTDGDGDTRPDD